MNQDHKTIARLAVQKVNPNGVYKVDYSIKHDGEKVCGDYRVLGKDLTEKQIVQLAIRGVL